MAWQDDEMAKRGHAVEAKLRADRQQAWADVQRMGPEAVQVLRDVVEHTGKLGGLPVVTWRTSK